MTDSDTKSLFDSLRKSSEIFRKGDRRQAIEEAFDELDKNGDGTLCRDDLKAFFEAAAEYVQLQVESDLIDAAVDALIEDVGGDEKEGIITRSQFAEMFTRHPDMITAIMDPDELSSRREYQSSELSVEEKIEIEKEDREAYNHAHTAWKNKRLYIIWLALYFAGNIAAFVYKAVTYARNDEATAVFGNCIAVARGAAQALNLNACLILLPICRHFSTWLRRTRARHMFPFDASLDIHFLIGAMIALFSLAHFAAHICDFTRFSTADEDDIYALFGDKLGPIPESSGDRWKLLLRQPAGITGIIMIFCLFVAYPFLWVRRTKFNLFWYTHHLLLVMLICLCFHGIGSLLEPFQSVYWVCFPLALYFFPRLWRETPRTSTTVIAAQIKHKDVLAIRLEKPKRWEKPVKAGMYAFVNVPNVSRSEWHPFTLTSAPCDDYIEFHIRRAGDWTERLFSLFEAIPKLQNDVELSAQFTRNNSGEVAGSTPPSYPVVRVEGPIGASSQGFSDYPVVVLIGAGIGVTPMISVLKQLLAEPGKMKRTFFYWTVRDRNAFEWFASLMDAIYDADQKHVLQVRHFLTSVKEDDRDLGAVLLHHATRSLHKKTDMDLLLGRRTHHQVEVGRPDWDEELQTVQHESKTLGLKDCGIFFCGPEKMADAIRESSVNLSKKDRDFHFFFSKETF